MALQYQRIQMMGVFIQLKTPLLLRQHIDTVFRNCSADYKSPVAVA
jgi:hypothetical protein